MRIGRRYARGLRRDGSRRRLSFEPAEVAQVILLFFVLFHLSNKETRLFPDMLLLYVNDVHV